MSRGHLVRLVGLTALAAALLAPRATRAEDPRFTLYGFVKTDVIYDFDRMQPAWSSVMRPSQIVIPGADTPYFDDGEIIFSVRPTRIGATFTHTVDERSIAGRLEIDFFGTGTNAGQHLPRMRQAYLAFGRLLVGQAWSLFNDADSWPVTMDFWGPCGMMASRRPQVRWTFRDDERRLFAMAVEQSGAGLDAGKGPQYDPDLDVRPRDVLPDVTLQYRWRGDGRHLQIAAVARELGYEGTTSLTGEPVPVTGSAFGWGAYLTMNWRTKGPSGLVGSFAYGHGIANYGNDGGFDVAPNFDNSPRALPLLGWHLAYDHWWNDRWATSFGASQMRQENAGGQKEGAFRRGSYTFVNLVQSPGPGLSYGVEVLWGKLVQRDGRSGEDLRVQWSSRFAF